ncbi:MAG: SHOCT domain-containing protein [Solirubrobacterales bacterium]
MMYRYGFGGFWMMPFMLICIAIVVLIVVLVMRSMGNHKTSDQNNKALEILDSKLASGEITEEEYQKRKQMILKG